MARKRKSNSKKGSSRKSVAGDVWTDGDWKVVHGKLVPKPGRPRKTKSLFRFVAEKLPFASLSKVRNQVKTLELKGKSGRAKGKIKRTRTSGVYLAHDSMGFARYGGRGQIFVRLASHQKKYPRELRYFSFYVIANKTHEREIETGLLRAAGPQLLLNERKVRSDISAGNVGDFEPGSLFFERQLRRGRQRRKTRKT